MPAGARSRGQHQLRAHRRCAGLARPAAAGHARAAAVERLFQRADPRQLRRLRWRPSSSWRRSADATFGRAADQELHPLHADRPGLSLPVKRSRAARICAADGGASGAVEIEAVGGAARARRPARSRPRPSPRASGLFGKHPWPDRAAPAARRAPVCSVSPPSAKGTSRLAAAGLQDVANGIVAGLRDREAAPGEELAKVRAEAEDGEFAGGGASTVSASNSAGRLGPLIRHQAGSRDCRRPRRSPRQACRRRRRRRPRPGRRALGRRRRRRRGDQAGIGDLAGDPGRRAGNVSVEGRAKSGSP